MSPKQPKLPFSGTFVLNLPEALERRAKIKQMLVKNDFQFEFMHAERGRHPDPEISAIHGGLWGHIKCVRAAKNMNWETVLIIEDDAVMHPRFYELLPDLTELEKMDWDIFYFYHIRDHQPLNTALSEPVKIIQIEYSILSHFYAVHERFYDEFLRVAVTSNWYSDRLFRGAPYKLFGLSSNLVGQAAGKSSITGEYFKNIRGLSF